MSQETKRKNIWEDPGILPYLVICLVALGAVGVILLRSGFGSWSLFPILVGLVSLVIRWSSGPIMFLLALAAALSVTAQGWQTQQPFPRFGIRPFDVLLGLAALAYVLAHYRMQSLSASVLPVDPRRRKKSSSGKQQVVQQPRSPRLVSQREIGWLVASLPLWALAAQAFWRFFSVTEHWNPNPDFLKPNAWRALMLVLIFGMFGLGAVSWISYVRWKKWTPEEAALFLQDTVWHETRREQRRVNRWAAWGRIRASRRRKSFFSLPWKKEPKE